MSHRHIHVTFTVSASGHITPSTPNQMHAKVHDIVVIQAVSEPPVPHDLEIYCLWNGEPCCKEVFGVEHLSPGREYQIRHKGPSTGAPYVIAAGTQRKQQTTLTMNGELHVGSTGGGDPM